MEEKKLGAFRSNDGKIDPIKVIYSVAAALIVMLITVTCTLLLWDRQHFKEQHLALITAVKETNAGFKERCADYDRREKQRDEYVRAISARVTRIEILVTMPFSDRMKALERLQRLIINPSQP